MEQAQVGIGPASLGAVLMAVALFGTLLSDVFQSSLNQKIGALALPPAMRTDIDKQRSKLAAVATGDLAARQSPQTIIGFRLSRHTGGSALAGNRQFAECRH